MNKPNVAVPRKTENRIGDRVIDPKSPNRLNDVQDVNERVAEELAKINDLMTSRICDEVRPMSALAGAGSFSEMVPLYQAAFSRLEQCQRDWQDLVSELICFEDDESLAKSTSTIQRQEHQEETKRWREQIRNDARLQPMPMEPTLEARMRSQPLASVRRDLESSLLDQCRRLGTEVGQGLVTLVELKICGLVEWYGHNDCKYNYYTRKMSTSLNAGEERSGRRRVSEEGREAWVETVTTSGTHTKLICCYVHHITNAVTLTVENKTIPAPVGRQQIIDRIPSWLRPEVRIVEGVLIRGISIRQDVEVSDWKSEREDRVQFVLDPAITIGPFVLTGWAQEDVTSAADHRANNDSDTEGSKGVPSGADPQSTIHLQGSMTTVYIGGIAALLGSIFILLGKAFEHGGLFVLLGYGGFLIFGLLWGDFAESHSHLSRRHTSRLKEWLPSASVVSLTLALLLACAMSAISNRQMLGAYVGLLAIATIGKVFTTFYAPKSVP